MYRDEIQKVSVWWSADNLALNTSKTKVMVKDYGSLVNDLLGSANFTAVVKNPHQRPHLKSGVSGLLHLHQ